MISSSNCNRAAELLGAAANVLSVEFYARQSDVDYSRPPTLECRTFSLHPMTKLTISEMSAELNAAIKPILERYARHLQQLAMANLSEQQA